MRRPVLIEPFAGRRAVLVFALNITFCFAAAAQQAGLPAGLDANSSPADIFKVLGERSIPNARFGLNFNAVELGDPNDATRYSEFAVFGKGFKLDEIDGCTVKLRTEKLELLKFTTGYPDPARGSFSNYRALPAEKRDHPAEIWIRLDGLSDSSGKTPRKYTKNADSMKLLGTWRSEYTLNLGKGGSVLFRPSKDKIKKALENAPLRLILKGSAPDGSDEKMTGNTFTLAFDDKSESETFDSLFRLAIRKCSQK